MYKYFIKIHVEKFDFQRFLLRCLSRENRFYTYTRLKIIIRSPDGICDNNIIVISSSAYTCRACEMRLGALISTGRSANRTRTRFSSPQHPRDSQLPRTIIRLCRYKYVVFIPLRYIETPVGSFVFRVV